MARQIKAEAYSPDNKISPLEAAFTEERTRLIRFCAHLTGNTEAAEDLAQETILEAWRNRWKAEEASDKQSLRHWLFAIARNVCMRWGRSRSQDYAHLAQGRQYEDEVGQGIEGISDAYDIELELERDELARLLDHALALLPPTIRDVLIERYIHESSHREIAERLGLSEDALVQRLYRGKIALRRVLTTKMRAETSAFALALPQKEELQQETSIWCPFCGTRRLMQSTDSSNERTGFSCPHCWQTATTFKKQLLAGVSSPRSILARQLAHLHDYYRQAIYTRQSACHMCGGLTHAGICQPQDIPEACGLPGAQTMYHGVRIICTSCGFTDTNTLPHLSLDTTEARQFWRKHPRMLWHPGQELEHEGQPALVSSFQSRDESAQLDLIYHRDTLVILHIRESFRY